MLEPILSIDLVHAARRSEDLKGQPEADLREAVRDYTRFLALAKAHPDVPLAPTRTIDAIWHLHMQHPRAYLADCLRIFGDVLDHDGGFGSTAEEEPLLADAFERTASLWLATFGVDYRGQTKCTRNCVSRCKRACKTGPGVQ